jgi:type I restriction enzyme S subunit
MMEKQKNIPVLRFPEFEIVENISYKKYLFRDIFNFSTGKSIKQNEASPDFETPCVRYGELYHLYNEVIKEVINKTNVDKSELLFSQGDEILLPSAGEDPLDIGSASALTVENVAIGRTINILKPMKANVYSQIYVAYYINQKLRKNISALAKGVSISNVYNSDLKTLEIILPPLPEQHKIASFFTAIDQKISQLKKKKDLLEQYKKGVMQKIFSQQIRFKDDDGREFPKWEKKRLGEISVKKASTISANTIDENFGEYPVYGATGFLKCVDFYIESNDYISIVKDGAGVGRLLYCKGNSSVLGTLDIIKPKAGLNTFFLYLLLSQIDFTKFITGSTIPHIYFKDYSKTILPIPIEKEQTKIANFLSALDDKIQHTQKQIEQAEQWKKGLMQKMFV